MGDSLQIALIVLGVVVVGVVYVFNIYQDRIARRRLESAFSPKPQGGQTAGGPAQVVSIQESLGDGIPLRGVPTAPGASDTAFKSSGHDTVSIDSPEHENAGFKSEAFTQDQAPSATDKISVAPATEEVRQDSSQPAAQAVSTSSPTQTSSLSPAQAIVNGAFDPDALPMPPVDLVVESVARIVSPEPISASVLQAAMTIPMTKAVNWLGWNENRQQWERLVAQALTDTYRVVIVSLLLVDRQGSVNDVQLNTFFRLIENLSKNVGGQCDLPRMETELQRALLLDRRCAELDIQINMSVMRSSQQGSIAATRLRGVAEACGFRWTKAGHFEFFDEKGEHLLFTLVNTQADQPFLPETLHTMQTHGVTLILDVPNVMDPLRAFDQMRSIAKRLTMNLDAVLVDDQRRMINEGSFSAIRRTIEQTVELMESYQIVPGSVRTLRLFS